MPEFDPILAAATLLPAALLVLAYIAARLIADGVAGEVEPAGWEQHLGDLGALTAPAVLPPHPDDTQDLSAYVAGSYVGRHHDDTVRLVPAAWRPPAVNPAFAYVLANWPREATP